MSSPKIRCDYDDLQKISQIFSAQNSEIARINRKIKSAQGTLEGGHWIGKGAKAFFKEMNGEVNPAMKRLEKAMAQAARITKQISKIMKQAEDDSSNIFKVSEEPSGPGSGEYA
jgi:WXG100 family type VII secretion target